MAAFTDCLVALKPGKVGSAEIIFDIPTRFDRLHGAIHGMSLNRDRYCRLVVDGGTMMTDAEFERRTNIEFTRHAHGHCLIAGLGIGLILRPALTLCNSVAVIEVNPDVVTLVGPQFPAVRIIVADINTYRPERKYDTIYLDIWSIFGDDQAREARRLKRRLRRYLAPCGWIGDWVSVATRMYRRRRR